VEVERGGWVSGVAESTWHRLAGYRRHCGFSTPVAGCGHVVIGPVRRRPGNPPCSGGRQICSGGLPWEVPSLGVAPASPVTITGRFAIAVEAESAR